ncbi:MAG: cobamide remodeling phosphodiesterase CbiR [Caldilinea sp.]
MNVRDWRAPFRIGATSYVVESDLLENARFLAQHVQDMQLVLFDIPDGPSNVPDAAAVDGLTAIGASHDLSYTVHLLDDLQERDANLANSSDAVQHPSLSAAQMLIERTHRLAPLAWVGHLDGRAVRARGFAADDLPAWWAQAVRAVKQVGAWAGDAQRLAIENLEGYPADFVTTVVEQAQAGRCVDVGHLWLDGHDPQPALCAAWRRLRVIHLHGVIDDPAHSNRDHRSLAIMAPDAVDSVVHLLLRNGYTGVLTLEVFGEDDFWSSLDALHASIQRYRMNIDNG